MAEESQTSTLAMHATAADTCREPPEDGLVTKSEIGTLQRDEPGPRPCREASFGNFMPGSSGALLFCDGFSGPSRNALGSSSSEQMPAETGH